MIRLLIVIASFVLVACTTTPDIESFADTSIQIAGRVSLTHDNRRDAGGFDYQLRGSIQQWTLYGPTGTLIGTLSADPSGAQWVTESGETTYAPSLDDLVTEAIGFAAPLASAKDWLRGRIPPQAQPREQGFQLIDWTVTWLKFNDAGQPRLISLTRGDTQIRLVAKSWN